MKFTQKDLDLLVELGAAVEVTPENEHEYNVWFNVLSRVYKSDGGLYAKVLVVSQYEKSELRGRLFIARGSMAYKF